MLNICAVQCYPEHLYTDHLDTKRLWPARLPFSQRCALPHPPAHCSLCSWTRPPTHRSRPSTLASRSSASPASTLMCGRARPFTSHPRWALWLLSGWGMQQLHLHLQLQHTQAWPVERHTGRHAHPHCGPGGQRCRRAPPAAVGTNQLPTHRTASTNWAPSLPPVRRCCA